MLAKINATIIICKKTTFAIRTFNPEDKLMFYAAIDAF
jgi:hypothetical protein